MLGNIALWPKKHLFSFLIFLAFITGISIENRLKIVERISPDRYKWSVSSRTLESSDSLEIVTLTFSNNGFEMIGYDGIHSFPDGIIDSIVAPMTLYLNRDYDNFPYNRLFDLCDRELKEVKKSFKK